MPELSFVHLTAGDPLPRFTQLCQGIQFHPDAMAGRFLVFCFYGSCADPRGRAALKAVMAHRDRFDDARMSLFAISTDPEDERSKRMSDVLPGIRVMWDFDRSVSRLLGAAPRETEDESTFRQFWLVVDPSLRVMAAIPFAPDGSDQEQVFDLLDRQPHPARFAGFEIPAPVLVIPNVFDQDLCRHLIGLYNAQGGDESGVMRNNTGVFDRSFKSRKDYTVEDAGLIGRIQGLIARRVLPDIERLFFMKITRMERYIVGCYAAEDGGHFRPHRDNNSGITQHRRFAVSINLNGDFEGGAVSFPEYNPRGIKAPPGWAVVFPCAALHMVSQVTSGRRYAFLPFVYDEAGAALRQTYLSSENARQTAPASQAAE
ncbi:2OG-Fe(II) oxygenase [Lichenifustis flavocetrariae]|uniref:2OG-Fe(II) oxygenase n=1 Tax=Lichenifustis flavocetrariae TaxID=2949735 RepID=A0AA41Z6U9_9HYPH|nr:2OG-Fe(II) oxygenase [Lichenifustis flavocetrariae]MCW6511425.1 2OG-Fe(II) oxygenase [Lichenifustis flavocetrariae]